ncbi:MAG: 16S rRNA (cytosine(1402)-N(4))-methyltransferase RsmH [Proteobacteria bacterium]|nr:16S rRNA (cytosine(1402)-N(4))-methyltransferase RsmH [Pseudomonadota bacterium]
MDSYHTPVLLNEVVSFLPESAKIAVDFTLGGAGHAARLLRQNPELYLYGIDRDRDALTEAETRLSSFQDRFSLIHSSFSRAVKRLIDDGVNADFVLADLGVSSRQLNNLDRGFSFRQDGPLDMRMDMENPVTAAEIVNRASEQELVSIIGRYGEESFCRRIARNIVSFRKKKAFSTTKELADCVKDAIPRKFHFGKIHPATKTFQAIRIRVNNELEELQDLLEYALDLLNSGGRIAIISFHSLEDRPVKQTFRKWEQPCQCPKTIPLCVCGLKPVAEPLKRKMIRPSKSEMESNPRSRSAKLRVVEKL